jgi:predicted glycoside hydrolase/deacetylase ChbG (UPF0249 family)
MKNKFDKKYLLITSDDFGMTHAVNLGILKGFMSGMINCSNFMAPCPWFDEAIQLTKKYNLPIGVHLNLTCEWTNYRWRPITAASSLTDQNGYFYPDYHYFRDNFDKHDVLAEYRAQIERVLSSGIEPTHIDTHMLPAMLNEYEVQNQEIAALAKEVADEYNLAYIYEVIDGKQRYFSSEFHMSGRTYAEVESYLNNLKNGIHNLICHLALPGEEQKNIASMSDKVYPWAAEYREKDLEIITSQRFKNLVERNNFELITIKDLMKLHVE